MDKEEIDNLINSKLPTNGQKQIKAVDLRDVLHEMNDSNELYSAGNGVAFTPENGTSSINIDLSYYNVLDNIYMAANDRIDGSNFIPSNFNIIASDHVKISGRDGIDLNTQDEFGDIQITAAQGGVSIGANGEFSQVGITGNNIYLGVNGTNSYFSIGGKDISYQEDYSENFTELSLVNKSWVEEQINSNQITISNNVDNRIITASGTNSLNAESNLVWDSSNNRLGINNTSPTGSLVVGTQSTELASAIGGAGGAYNGTVILSNTTNANLVIENTSASTSVGGAIVSLLANDGAALANGHRMGGFLFGGFRGNGISNSVAIMGYTDATWTTTSSPGSIVFETTPTGSTSRTERLRVKGDGNISINNYLGIGISSPQAKLHVSDGTTVNSNLIGSDEMIISKAGLYRVNYVSSGNNATDRPVLLATRSRGTLGSPTAVQNNDLLFQMLAGGYSGSGAAFHSAALEMYVDGTVTSSTVPTRISFTTGNHSTTRSERLQIKSDGKIIISDLSGTGTRLVTASATGELSTTTNFNLPTSIPSSPINGSMYYDASTHKFKGYANGSWVDLH